MKSGQNRAEGIAEEAVRAGDLLIEPGLRRVTRGDEELSLPGLSFDVLMALVRAAPNLVTSERLIEEVWQGQIVSPETITQRIKLLRDALGDDSQNPKYVAGVRGRGYRLVPPIRRAAGASATSSRQPRTVLWLAAALVLLAALVAASVIFSRRPALAPVAAKPDGLAVLPFENRSQRSEDAFFAEGIHDDLLTRLSRIRNLRVIARGSVRDYRDRSASMQAIARELGVGAVLAGAVQRSGDRVRIHVQLIDAERNAQLWAETYDRSMTVDNVFDIQSDISRAIAAKLQITLRAADRERIERPHTSSLAAYEAWLRGRQAMSRYTEEGFTAAVDHFQRALLLDPQFALAHVGLAETRLLQERFRLLNRELATQLAGSSAERALAIDPTLAEAFAAKGDVLRLRGDAHGAEAALRQAIALNPNLAAAWISYGWVVAEQGRRKEQREMWLRASRLDPHSPAVRVYGAFTHLRSGRLRQAEEELRALLADDPDFPPGHVILGETLAGRGDQAAAVAHFRRALELNPNLPLAHAGLVHALLDLGADTSAAEAVADAWSVPDTPRLGPGLELLLDAASGGTAVTPERRRAMIDELRKHDPVAAAEYAALVHLARGDAAAARAELAPLESRLRDAAGCTYAFALVRTGETTRGGALARRLLQEARESAEQAPRRLLAPIICSVALGQEHVAVTLLRESMGDGRVPSGWRTVASRPELAQVRRSREFDALLATIRSEAARQREAAGAHARRRPS